MIVIHQFLRYLAGINNYIIVSLMEFHFIVLYFYFVLIINFLNGEIISDQGLCVRIIHLHTIVMKFEAIFSRINIAR